MTSVSSIIIILLIFGGVGLVIGAEIGLVLIVAEPAHKGVASRFVESVMGRDALRPPHGVAVEPEETLFQIVKSRNGKKSGADRCSRQQREKPIIEESLSTKQRRISERSRKLSLGCGRLRAKQTIPLGFAGIDSNLEKMEPAVDNTRWLHARAEWQERIRGASRKRFNTLRHQAEATKNVRQGSDLCFECETHSLLQRRKVIVDKQDVLLLGTE
mmetsp:Transcript_11770/g.36317  ORF Transcript_11770/g.36317 Transcript_11770/m.36317 type:complete len:215 (+) Transcript_11770:175-819(+)